MYKITIVVTEMAVIEFGVMMDGLPIFTLDWQTKTGDDNDKILRSGLITAIQSFALDAFGDVMDTLTLKNLKIHFHQVIKNQSTGPIELVTYCITDPDTRNIKSTRKALIKSANDIVEAKYEISSLRPDRNAFIISIIEKRFKKIKLRQEDRAQSLFGD